jgi:hypothetical protein
MTTEEESDQMGTICSIMTMFFLYKTLPQMVPNSSSGSQLDHLGQIHFGSNSKGCNYQTRFDGYTYAAE